MAKPRKVFTHTVKLIDINGKEVSFKCIHPSIANGLISWSDLKGNISARAVSNYFEVSYGEISK